MSKRTKYKIAKATMTCGACPSQWDAWTDEGRYIYIRYRYGYLCVTTTRKYSQRSKEILSKTIGDRLAGVMSSEEMMHVTRKKLDWSECVWEEESD